MSEYIKILYFLQIIILLLFSDWSSNALCGRNVRCNETQRNNPVVVQLGGQQISPRSKDCLEAPPCLCRLSSRPCRLRQRGDLSSLDTSCLHSGSLQRYVINPIHQQKNRLEISVMQDSEMVWIE